MDPNRGYNFVKLHLERQGVNMIGLNTAIERVGAAWVPVKAAWEVRIARPPDFSMSYRHEIAVGKLEIDPNDISHNPFAMGDVPEGTKTTFLGVGGRPMPGNSYGKTKDLCPVWMKRHWPDWSRLPMT
jgi:hypothetical protein